jgi:hypothetical protein
MRFPEHLRVSSEKELLAILESIRPYLRAASLHEEGVADDEDDEFDDDEEENEHHLEEEGDDQSPVGSVGETEATEDPSKD